MGWVVQKLVNANSGLKVNSTDSLKTTIPELVVQL